MSMEEAFREAARGKPRSELSDQVFDAARRKRDSGHQTTLVYLTKDFTRVGTRWMLARVLSLGRVSHNLPEIRQEWVDVLQRRKRTVRTNSEGELLLKVMIEEGINPERLDRIGALESFDATLQWPPQEMGLSLGSRLFVYAVSDLSRHNKQQQDAFAHFIQEGREKAGFNMHDLPVVIPLVNTWLNTHS